MKPKHATKILRYVSIFVISLFIFSGCKKEDQLETVMHHEIPVAETHDFIPEYPNTDGTLIAIRNSAFSGPVGFEDENFTGEARAIFPDSIGSFRQVGNVKVLNTDLSLQQNLSPPTATNPLGYFRLLPGLP